MTSWKYIKNYLMQCVKQTWLCVFCVCSACVVQSVTHHVWVLSVALALESRPAEMCRVLIVLAKSWKKIEIMKKDWNPEILRIYGGIYTWIMKQDWNPEIRLKSWNKISSGKTKLLHLCSTITSFCAPAWPPFFCAEVVITTDLATCLHVRLWLLLL
jgi:hypothetical protein